MAYAIGDQVSGIRIDLFDPAMGVQIDGLLRQPARQIGDDATSEQHSGATRLEGADNALLPDHRQAFGNFTER